MNEGWNHWIVNQEPFVVMKAAMSLDGKIATRTGDSKWITGTRSRAAAMQLRRESDAILIGINTLIADDPALTLRGGGKPFRNKNWLKVVLDAEARTPVDARVFENTDRRSVLIVTSGRASQKRRKALEKRAEIWTVPETARGLKLRPLMRRLGREREITQLLVEGGGEVHASFLRERLVHRIAFFYAPIIVGGSTARKAIAGEGIPGHPNGLSLSDPIWSRLGRDLLLTARVA
jgi:diaminohydroxyphosphoribosylaminopyrimidine deaminase/5-amino-6-(5-phosphoribosylamino)uracil reductase